MLTRPSEKSRRGEPSSVERFDLLLPGVPALYILSMALAAPASARPSGAAHVFTFKINALIISASASEVDWVFAESGQQAS